ncbi:DUF927 domain-containing protein [Methanosarcina sp. T3]|uniref:DUF927 domain-containing protein n=1 Tax=Methanosarcina sp. T3 TaxID=3439062 RepID=UPI003F829F29
MATLKDQLLSWYNKIPYDSDVDSSNLNYELVDIMLLSEELRELMSWAGNWGAKEFEKVADILRGFGVESWEAFKVFETYSPEFWDSNEKELKEKITQIMEYSVDLAIDVFQVDYDLYPYRVSKNGIEIIDKSSDQEQYNTITETPIVITATGTNLDDDSFLYQCTYQNVIGVRQTKWVTPTQLLTTDLKELINMGLHLTDLDSKHMRTYFKKMVKHAPKMPREYTAKKTGWKKEDSIFIIGENLFSAKGKTKIISLDDSVTNAYGVKGDLDYWIKTMTPMLEYDLTRIKCYAVVCAMLLKIIDAPSFIIHNYYESSGSKTITMDIAISLIGNPGNLRRDASISEVGLEKAAALNTDTALFVDETTKTPDFSKMVYTLVNGRGKTRGTVSNNEVGLAKMDTWRNVTLTTGEYTLTQYLSTATGISTRVIEIYEGIQKMDDLYIREVEETVINHHGFFLDDIMDTIFKSKSVLKTRYQKIRGSFEKSSTTFAARKKNYFAALALAGQILESVFKNYNIPNKNPLEICENYYISTSVKDSTIPYYEKALETVYSWHLRNRRSFEYSSDMDPEDTYSPKGNVEIKGWVTPSGIIYDPDMLRKYLESKGLNFDRAIKDWSDKEILTRRTDGKTWKFDSTIKGKKIRGVYITYEKFQEVLKIRDSEVRSNILTTSDEKTKDGSEIILNSGSQTRVELRKKCEGFLREFPEMKTIEYTAEDAAKEFVKTEEGSEILLNYGFPDIELMFKKLKQRV